MSMKTPQSFGPVEVVLSQLLNNSVVLYHSQRKPGYVYRFARTTNDLYRCSQCRHFGKERCITVVNGVIMGYKNPEDGHHAKCQPQPEAAVRAKQIDLELRNYVRMTGKKPRDAYAQMLSSIARQYKSPEQQAAIIAHLPSLNKIRGQLTRHRRAHNSLQNKVKTEPASDDETSESPLQGKVKPNRADKPSESGGNDWMDGDWQVDISIKQEDLSTYCDYEPAAAAAASNSRSSRSKRVSSGVKGQSNVERTAQSKRHNSTAAAQSCTFHTSLASFEKNAEMDVNSVSERISCDDHTQDCSYSEEPFLPVPSTCNTLNSEASGRTDLSMNLTTAEPSMTEAASSSCENNLLNSNAASNDGCLSNSAGSGGGSGIGCTMAQKERLTAGSSKNVSSNKLKYDSVDQIEKKLMKMPMFSRLLSAERYKCNVCDKVINASHRYTHKIAHSEHKGYKCAYCSACFSYYSGLSYHHKSQHEFEKMKYDILKPSSSDNKESAAESKSSPAVEVTFSRVEVDYEPPKAKRRSLKCNICGYVATRSGNFNKHLRQHTNERPYKCWYCASYFKNYASVTWHHKAKHKAEPFKYEFIKPNSNEIILENQFVNGVDDMLDDRAADESWKETKSSDGVIAASSLPGASDDDTIERQLAGDDCARCTSSSGGDVSSSRRRRTFNCSYCSAAFTANSDYNVHCINDHVLPKLQQCGSCCVDLVQHIMQYICNHTTEKLLLMPDGGGVDDVSDFKLETSNLSQVVAPRSKDDSGQGSLKPENIDRSASVSQRFISDVASADFYQPHVLESQDAAGLNGGGGGGPPASGDEPQSDFSDLEIMEDIDSDDLQIIEGLTDSETDTDNEKRNVSREKKPRQRPKVGHNRYQCWDCKEIVVSWKSFRVHRREKHRNVKCTLCDRVCTTAKDLEYHMRSHTGERPFQCNICSKTFTYQQNYTTHLATHQRPADAPKMYLCFDCGKSYLSAKTLKIHMKTHSNECPHKCPVCSKGFKRLDALKSHLRVHRSQLLATTQQQQQLQQHVNDASTDNNESIDTLPVSRNFAASTDGQPAEPRSDVNASLKTSLDTAGSSSSSIDLNAVMSLYKRSDFKSALTKHYMCNVCGKSFFSNPNLVRHLRIHSGEKPYKCLHCSKTFSDSGNMAHHMRVHSGARPYKCQECGRQFSQPQSLKVHLASHARKLKLAQKQ